MKNKFTDEKPASTDSISRSLFEFSQLDEREGKLDAKSLKTHKWKF